MIIFYLVLKKCYITSFKDEFPYELNISQVQKNKSEIKISINLFIWKATKINHESIWGIKIKYTFAHAWRDGRVVDCGGLENRCTERYRGFESLSLRNKDLITISCGFHPRFYTLKQEYGCSSVGRALVSKTRCRAFESLLPC